MNEKDLSILIGGRAGSGVDRAGTLIARLFGALGYYIYVYRDYPSIIRGGHTFSIVRASSSRIACHKERLDILLALNEDTLRIHAQRLHDQGIVIYDSDITRLPSLPSSVKVAGVPISAIIKEESAPDVMRNTCIVGALAKTLGIKRQMLQESLAKEMPKDLEINSRVINKGYDALDLFIAIQLSSKGLPFLSGNSAIALGLVKAGLKAYLAYPMTPSSPILHFLAENADVFDIKVIHPESEIAAIMMALGMAYAGVPVATGTSGGGFCLMTEGLSFSGMAELPVVIILGQRPGPSTGLPTYSCQTELQFALSAGQGEFVRLLVAPGDAEEGFFLAALALRLSLQFQIPAIILSDKNMAEHVSSFDMKSVATLQSHQAPAWNGQGLYKRYALTDSGVSPVAPLPLKATAIKVNSYEHDESGISIEDPAKTGAMQDKRLRKDRALRNVLAQYSMVKVGAATQCAVALIFWGSNKGVCCEAAHVLGLKAIQVLLFSPFPKQQLQESLAGVTKLICVESNATAQMAQVLKGQGFSVDDVILKYDGRPFSLEELINILQKKI